MNQQEAIEYLYNMFFQENKKIALQSGMSESDFDSKMAPNEQTLIYIFGNMYTKMKEDMVIA